MAADKQLVGYTPFAVGAEDSELWVAVVAAAVSRSRRSAIAGDTLAVARPTEGFAILRKIKAVEPKGANLLIATESEGVSFLDAFDQEHSLIVCLSNPKQSRRWVVKKFK